MAHYPPPIARRLAAVTRIHCFGEVLVDEFEDGAYLGGAPFNVAFRLAQDRQAATDLPVALISAVGDDGRGRRIREVLQTHGIDTACLGTSTAATGLVTVELDAAGQPVFTLAENAAWDAIAAIPERLDGALLYYGTLALRGPANRRTWRRLVRRLARETSGLRFCDLNLRPPHDAAAVVREALLAADILKVSTDELSQLEALALWGPLVQTHRGSSPEQLAQALFSTARAAGSTLQVLLVTDGPRGAFLVSAHDREEREILLSAAPPPAVSVVDATGAGDVFCAVFLARALAGARAGESFLQQALDEAVRQATLSCAERGATPVAQMVAGKAG
ncbi:MAG: PfkB family carbohydrate kinase [Acidobacteriota bacterium]|nr:PfkB family carbohydrate kinase [Acidobacteriota bacterium]